MINNQFLTNDKKILVDEKKRKPYHAPKLEILGDLRTLTLGGSNHLSMDTGNHANGDWTRLG
jgi:hypothetical protein